MSSNDQGFAAGADPSQFQGSDQGMGGGYDGMAQSSQTDEGMGGGAGAHGSGVAGGYSSNADQQQTSNTTGEKKDWLDKGIEWAGKKAGVNVVRVLSRSASASLADHFAGNRVTPMPTKLVTSPTRSSTSMRVSQLATIREYAG